MRYNTIFEDGGWVFNRREREKGRKHEFPIIIEAGDKIEINGILYLALAKTKATPIELSHCRACSLFRKPICGLLKCENVRFERVNRI